MPPKKMSFALDLPIAACKKGIQRDVLILWLTIKILTAHLHSVGIQGTRTRISKVISEDDCALLAAKAAIGSENG